MPRKAAVSPSSEPAAEPRRSTRISSLPKLTPTGAPEKKPRKTTKKRTADEIQIDGDDMVAAIATGGATVGPTGKEDQSNKKAKKDIAEVDEEKDELASDVSEQPKLLEIGDVLPDITLKNEKEENVNVQDLAKDHGVVIFLVPKADTPGCTTQACGYRDIYPDFEAAHYKVYCLSADTSIAQSKWQTKKSLPYPLLSDKQRVLIKALGAAVGNKTTRSHFVFEKGGKLVDRRVPVKPADSPRLAMEFIKGQNTSS